MKNNFTLILLLMLSFLRGSASINTALPKLTEEEKINKLIDYVRNLKGAVFIRNGSEYTPAQAADHLAMKRKKGGNKIKTAVQFIVYCASKSSVSGKDYMVKMADGKMVKTLDLLVEELKRIEKENK